MRNRSHGHIRLRRRGVEVMRHVTNSKIGIYPLHVRKPFQEEVPYPLRLYLGIDERIFETPCKGLLTRIAPMQSKPQQLRGPLQVSYIERRYLLFQIQIDMCQEL